MQNVYTSIDWCQIIVVFYSLYVIDRSIYFPIHCFKSFIAFSRVYEGEHSAGSGGPATDPEPLPRVRYPKHKGLYAPGPGIVNSPGVSDRSASR